MKKRLFAILLTLFMVLQCSALVYADAWTDSVDVDLDMEVKRSAAAVYQNGPVAVTGAVIDADFRTTLQGESVYAKFIEWYERSLRIIDNMVVLEPTLNKDDLVSQLNALPITGEFTVTIWYPKALKVPEAFITGGDMYGFNEDAKKCYYEISRTHDTSGSVNNIITIKIGVKSEAGGNLSAGELNENKAVYLADISLAAENIRATSSGTYTVIGTLTGYTETAGTIGSKTTSLHVDYNCGQMAGGENPSDVPENISATITLTRPAGPQGGGGGTSSGGRVVFNIDGKITEIPPIEKTSLIKYEDLPTPTKPGHIFGGWYYDSTFKNKVEGDVKVSGTITLYAHWISETLETEDHFAYVIGYPDGLVRPEGNITREEVATIFYRLLREDKRISIVETENDFSDVDVSRWSNKAISSLAKDGYIKGYEDGTFRPENNITRAEFAVMATRFDQLVDKGGDTFSDLIGHWSEADVLKAAHEGWIQGYEDGTFRPEQYITRAEVMTIINRMLVRCVDSEGLHKDTKFWTDMDESDWYYYNVLEATNAHKYERKEDGITERWTEITPNKIWIELDEMENAD